MSRPSNPQIKARLREKAIDYVLKNGYAAVSLRPMAKQLKTNARMLIYHFESREGLMREILMGLREREDRMIQEWLVKQKTSPTMADFLRWYWGRLSSPEARPALLLVFELYALALRDPESYPGVLNDPIAYWHSLVMRAGLREKDDAQATLLLAATRGLLLDLVATNDRARISKALDLLAKCMNASDYGRSIVPPSRAR